MPGGPGGSRPRPGGGMNLGMGGLHEHLDENALQQAMSQKSLSQQATNQQTSLQQGQGGGKAVSDLSQLQQAEAMQQMAGQSGAGTPAKVRPVGSLKDELVTRPLEDIGTGLKSLFDINAFLGIQPQTDTPEQQAKKRQLHQRWQKLTEEQQQVAQQKYQQEMQQKKQAEEAEQLRKQQEEETKSQTIQAPASPQKGPKGPGGSKKQRAQTKLQNDRKKLGGPGSSN